jgi:hypothetical protein
MINCLTFRFFFFFFDFSYTRCCPCLSSPLYSTRYCTRILCMRAVGRRPGLSRVLSHVRICLYRTNNHEFRPVKLPAFASLRRRVCLYLLIVLLLIHTPSWYARLSYLASFTDRVRFGFLLHRATFIDQIPRTRLGLRPSLMLQTRNCGFLFLSSAVFDE